MYEYLHVFLLQILFYTSWKYKICYTRYTHCNIWFQPQETPGKHFRTRTQNSIDEPKTTSTTSVQSQWVVKMSRLTSHLDLQVIWNSN